MNGVSKLQFVCLIGGGGRARPNLGATRPPN